MKPVPEITFRRIPDRDYRPRPSYIATGHPFGDWAIHVDSPDIIVLENVDRYVANRADHGTDHGDQQARFLIVRGIEHRGSVVLRTAATMSEEDLKNGFAQRRAKEVDPLAFVRRTWSAAAWSRTEAFSDATKAAAEALSDAAENVVAQFVKAHPEALSEARVIEAEEALAEADEAYAKACSVLAKAKEACEKAVANLAWARQAQKEQKEQGAKS